jgi:NADH-quinone oxidoreductase subunit F
MSREEVIAEIKASELRGRGGAGFSCGAKWEMAASSADSERFFICNADEGEIGTFKDRYLLENDPFSIIEGILIACYAIEAKRAFIYLREEYTFLAKPIRSAIEQTVREKIAEGVGIQVVEGAGAYICGEESALMESIEGKRGEPRIRPPFPTSRGLFGKPTVINNVETLMNIPWILINGAQRFREIGTRGNRGTKVFCVSGDVLRPGVYELPLGTSLEELIYGYAGAEDVQLVQVGGGSGRIIPKGHLGMPLTYETALGSGAVMVMDHTRDVLDVVYLSLAFFAEESCGKCAPCREGTKVLLETLKRIQGGLGGEGDIQIMEEVGQVMQMSSICGLGQSAPIPLLDSLKHYRSMYESRIAQSRLLRSIRGYERS